MKNTYILLIALAAFGFGTAFTITQPTEEQKLEAVAEKEKSVGYYVANTQEALAKNKACYDMGGEAKSDANCANSLHALQISLVGGERIVGDKYNRQ